MTVTAKICRIRSGRCRQPYRQGQSRGVSFLFPIAARGNPGSDDAVRRGAGARAESRVVRRSRTIKSIRPVCRQA